MASYAQVESLMEAATDALAASDYATAEEKAVAAQGILSILPIDFRKEGHASGSLRYSEMMIDQFIERVKRLGSRKNRSNSSLGIQTARVRFSSGRCGENDCEVGCE